MNRGVRAQLAALIIAVPVLVNGQAGAGIAFRTSDTGADGPEVNIGITSRGVLFFGGWDHIARSIDDGRTWQPTAELSPFRAAGDRVLIVDRDTDRVFVDDTELVLDCTWLKWSDDLGETWELNLRACGGGLTDHQKIAVGKRTILQDVTNSGYPNVVYVCANGLAYSHCSASPDGGRTFLPSVPTNGDSRPCAFQGVPVTGPDGTLYQPKLGEPLCLLTRGPRVEISHDNGLTWTSVLVSPDVAYDYTDLAITPDGTVYCLWIKVDDSYRPYLSRSRNGGLTWDEPMPLAPSLRAVWHPAIAAGADGKVGFAFYGTTDEDPTWLTGPPGAPDAPRWYLYAGTITGADTGSPTISLARATQDPIQIGRGGATGNIADYIDAEVGPNGRLYVAYVDGCPPGCDDVSESTQNDGFVAIQTRGPRLL
jgi:hypothetical protein